MDTIRSDDARTRRAMVFGALGALKMIGFLDRHVETMILAEALTDLDEFEAVRAVDLVPDVEAWVEAV